MHPGPERHWQIIERYGVTQYYTAPTLIRAFIKSGPQHPAAHDLSLAAPAGVGRRADQPRGLGVVLEVHRRRALPDRRHVVADRDRRHPDHAAARARRPPSPARPRGRSPASARRSSTSTATRCAPGSGGYLVITPAVAGDVPHALPRRRALRLELLLALRPAHLLPGRRRPPGRRGLLLAARPGGRRHERVRPPALDDRARVDARRAPGGGRGGGDGGAGPAHRADAALLRAPARRPRAERRARGRAARVDRPEDRQDRPARRP